MRSEVDAVEREVHRALEDERHLRAAGSVSKAKKRYRF